MTRRTKQVGQAPVAAPQSTTDIAETIYREALLGILAAVRSAADNPDDPEKASLLGTLAQKASAVGAEYRKAEAAERKYIAELNRGDIIAWTRQLTPDQRAQFLREVKAIDSTTSVLA